MIWVPTIIEMYLLSLFVQREDKIYWSTKHQQGPFYSQVQEPLCALIHHANEPTHLPFSHPSTVEPLYNKHHWEPTFCPL